MLHGYNDIFYYNILPFKKLTTLFYFIEKISFFFEKIAT